MANSAQTTRGENPKEVFRGFEISTSQLQEYLQGKVNSLCAAGGFKDPVKVNLMSFRLSRKYGKQFVPFLLNLSESALVRERSNDDDDINPIFVTGTQSNDVRLIDPIYKMIQSMKYTKNGIKWLCLPKTKKELNIPQRSVSLIYEFANPRKLSSGKGSVTISVWLDPIKVFYDYLINPNNPKERFRINIRGVKSVNNDLFVYCVERERYSRSADDGAIDVKKKIMRQLSEMD